MDGFKDSTRMKYMSDSGGTYNERGRRATMGEIAAEDRRMSGRKPAVEGVSSRPTDSSGRRASDAELGMTSSAKKAVGPSSVAVSKVLAGMAKPMKKAMGGSVSDKPMSGMPVGYTAKDQRQTVFTGRSPRGSGTNDGGPMPTSVGGVRPPKGPVKPSRPAPPPRIPASVLADYERGLTPKTPFVPGKSPRGSGTNDGGPNNAPSSVGGVRPPKGPVKPVMVTPKEPERPQEAARPMGVAAPTPMKKAAGGMAKKAVPAYNDRPVIRRSKGGLMAMPKGKC